MFPFRRSSLRFAFALAGDRFEVFDSRIILKSIHPLDQSRSGNSKISLLSFLSFFIGKSQELKAKKESHYVVSPYYMKR